MEMCPEITVLVSAVQLSSKYSEDTNESSHDENFIKSLEILKHAVGEITQGLEMDRSENQKSLWHYKLHSFLFCSVLRSSCGHGKEAGITMTTGTLGYLETLGDIFPPIGRELYYEIAKQCGWTDHLVECLLHLRPNEEIWLQFLQDILSYCLQRQHSSASNMSNDLDLLLAVTEHLVTINFVEMVPENEVVDRERKASGLYIDMGMTPSARPVPPSDRNKNYKDIFETLLSCVQGIFNSIEKADVPCQTESTKHFRAHRLVRLIIGIIALGGTYFLGKSVATQGETGSELQQMWEKWAGIFISNNAPEKLGDTRKHFDDLQKYIVKLQKLGSNYGDRNILQEIKDLSSQNHSRQIPSLLFPPPMGHQVFSVKQWCLTVVEILKDLVWTECLISCMEFTEDKSSYPTAVSSVAGINVCQLFVELRNVLIFVQSTKMTSVFTHNSQMTENIPVTGDCGDGMSTVKENEGPKSDISGNGSIDEEKGVQLSEGCENVDQLLKLLQPLSDAANDFLERMKIANYQHESPALESLTLEQLFVKIEERLLGWEDCVEFILEKNDTLVWSQKSVYDVLADNIDILCCEGRILRLLDIIRTRTSLLSDQKAQLWKIIIAAFSGLPVLLQDQLVCDWYTRGSHLTPRVDNLSQQSLTLVFNRLVNGGLTEVKEVSSLAVQDASAVMHKALSIAVKNIEQFSLIVKILRRMPNTCRARREIEHPDTPLLCKVTHTFLATNSLSETDEQNLMNFVELAVQSFDDDYSLSNYTFTEDPVLDPQEFLDSCVLPYLNRDNMILGSQPITAMLALKLFRVISSSRSRGQGHCSIGQNGSINGQGHSTEGDNGNVNGQEHKNRHDNGIANGQGHGLPTEVQSHGPAPQTLVTLLCVCEMLQECDAFWDSESSTRKELMKPDLISAIDNMVQALRDDSSQISAPCLSWFSQAVKTWDTPVIMRVRHLYGGNQEQLQVLANRLCQDLHRSTSVLTEFLKFSAVDEACLAASVSAVDRLDRDVNYEQLVSTLVQLLPNLLSLEWFRVLAVCNRMVCRQNRTMDCTFVTSLPLTDLSELQRPLCLMQLLVDVFMIWNQSEWMRHEMWTYVTPGFVNIVKKSCLPNSSVSSAKNYNQILRRVFHFTQIFCQLCQVVSVLPPSAMEQVYVLLLQTMSLYKGVRELVGTASSVLKFCEKQEVTMKMVIESCIHGNAEWTLNLRTQLAEIQNPRPCR